jgi:hypothetical protein
MRRELVEADEPHVLLADALLPQAGDGRLQAAELWP